MPLLLPVLAYSLLAPVGVVAVHEGTHVLAAVAFGVPLREIEVGFYGIHPSVKYPEWFAGPGKAIVFYTGGVTAGIVALGGYAHWFRRFRRERSLTTWLCALVTVVLAAWQLSNGYLEGRHTALYIMGSASPFSVSHLVMGYWMVAAVTVHVLLNPRRLLRTL